MLISKRPIRLAKPEKGRVEPEKPQGEGDQERATVRDEVEYWTGLLRRLGEEGYEDAGAFIADLRGVIESGGDEEAVVTHLVLGLLRLAVVQGYQRPVTPEKTENFNMRISPELLQKIDAAVMQGSARNRSEFVRLVLDLSFSGVDPAGMRHRVALMEITADLLKNPEELLLFYLVRSFFERPDVASLGKMLASIARPLSEIMAAVGPDSVERIQETVRHLLELSDTPDSELEDVPGSVE